MAEKPTTIDEYLTTLTDEPRDAVQRIRALIHEMVPDGQDCISYGIAAVKLDGLIVLYYSGWKQHVSVYPIPPGSATFQKRIAPYIAGKGTLRFLLSDPLPIPIISEIISAHTKRVEAALTKKKAKQASKT